MKNQKGLSLFQLVSFAAGQVIGAGVVVLIGQAIAKTGLSSFLAYSLAVVMGFCIILPYLLVSSMLRVNGGNYSFVSALLGNKWGGVFGLAFSMNAFATGMIGLGFGSYVNALLPEMSVKFVALAAITVFYLFNLLGVNFMAKIQGILSTILICGLTLFIVVGFGKVDFTRFSLENVELFSNGNSGFMAAIVLLVYSCYGHCFVVAYSKEAANAKRDVPLAMLITTGILLFFYTAIAFVAAGVLPLADVAGKPLTVVAKEIMSPPLYYAFVIFGPLMAIATTLNSSFTVFSRPFHQMTSDNWFNQKLATENRFGAPIYILTLIYLIAILPILLNVSIAIIVVNTVLLGRVADLVAIYAVYRLPDVLPDAWDARQYQWMSLRLFKNLVRFSFAITLLCILLGLQTITITNVVNTIVLIAAFYGYINYRDITAVISTKPSFSYYD